MSRGAPPPAPQLCQTHRRFHLHLHLPEVRGPGSPVWLPPRQHPSLLSSLREPTTPQQSHRFRNANDRPGGYTWTESHDHLAILGHLMAREPASYSLTWGLQADGKARPCPRAPREAGEEDTVPFRQEKDPVPWTLQNSPHSTEPQLYFRKRSPPMNTKASGILNVSHL